MFRQLMALLYGIVCLMSYLVSFLLLCCLSFRLFCSFCLALGVFHDVCPCLLSLETFLEDCHLGALILGVVYDKNNATNQHTYHICLLLF